MKARLCDIWSGGIELMIAPWSGDRCEHPLEPIVVAVDPVRQIGQVMFEYRVDDGVLVVGVRLEDRRQRGDVVRERCAVEPVGRIDTAGRRRDGEQLGATLEAVE